MNACTNLNPWGPAIRTARRHGRVAATMAALVDEKLAAAGRCTDDDILRAGFSIDELIEYAPDARAAVDAHRALVAGIEGAGWWREIDPVTTEQRWVRMAGPNDIDILRPLAGGRRVPRHRGFVVAATPAEAAEIDRQAGIAGRRGDTPPPLRDAIC